MGKIGTIQDYRDWIGSDKKMFGKEDCPFCDLELQKEYTPWTGKYWKIIKNKFPYSGDHRHLMVVPIEHICYGHEATADMWSEMADIHAWMRDFYGDEHYFSFTRETTSNRSVEHLHMHFCPGALKATVIRHMLKDQGFPVI